MHYNIARSFLPAPRAEIGPLADACVAEMAGYLCERIDGKVITSGDREAIDRHVRGLVETYMDGHPEIFAAILKQHLLDELIYRVVARSYLD